MRRTQRDALPQRPHSSGVIYRESPPPPPPSPPPTSSPPPPPLIKPVTNLLDAQDIPAGITGIPSLDSETLTAAKTDEALTVRSGLTSENYLQASSKRSSRMIPRQSSFPNTGFRDPTKRRAVKSARAGARWTSRSSIQSSGSLKKKKGPIRLPKGIRMPSPRNKKYNVAKE
ncbi:hypothetical protein AAMO2058_000787100 [Amorphochlora amoebiformis]